MSPKIRNMMRILAEIENREGKWAIKLRVMLKILIGLRKGEIFDLIRSCRNSRINSRKCILWRVINNRGPWTISINRKVAIARIRVSDEYPKMRRRIKDIPIIVNWDTLPFQPIFQYFGLLMRKRSQSMVIIKNGKSQKGTLMLKTGMSTFEKSYVMAEKNTAKAPNWRSPIRKYRLLFLSVVLNGEKSPESNHNLRNGNGFIILSFNQFINSFNLGHIDWIRLGTRSSKLWISICDLGSKYNS